MASKVFYEVMELTKSSQVVQESTQTILHSMILKRRVGWSFIEECKIETQNKREYSLLVEITFPTRY
jgi:hypothetical protein